MDMYGLVLEDGMMEYAEPRQTPSLCRNLISPVVMAALSAPTGVGALRPERVVKHAAGWVMGPKRPGKQGWNARRVQTIHVIASSTEGFVLFVTMYSR